MLDMFSQYIYYLDLALLGILGLFVIGGLIAGVKKSLISFSLLILLVVGLYIGLNPICNLLLDVNAEWMGITSFRDAIVSEITNNVPEISSLMIEGTAVYNLVMNITVTVMRLIVFFVGSLVIVFVIEPILRVIVKVILGVRKKKGQKKLRLLGAGVNFLKGVFILTLVFFPIGGSIGLVKELRTVIEETNEQELALMPLAEGYVTNEYQEVFDLVEAFENLRFKKIINVSKFVLGKPLDEYIFNKTLMLKHEGKKSYIVDDLKEGLKIASIYLRYSENGEFDIYQISEEDLTTIVESLKKIKTIDVILPVVVEIALNFDEVKAELEKFNINANDIINLKWAEDFDILFEIGKEVILLGEIDEDSLLELETAKVRSIINKLSSTSILQYAFPKALEYLVTLDEVKPYLGEDFTFDFDKINLTTELGILVDIYDELKVIGFKDFDFEEVLNDNDKFDAVLAIVGKVASSDLLNQALPNLADNLMKEELPESFSGIVDIEGVDLSEEINKVLNIIKGLHNLGINFDSGFEDIDLTKLNTDDVLDIIDQIFDLDLFDEKELFRALFRELEIEGADDYDFGDMDLEVEKEAIKHVVSKMVIFIKGANTTDFEDFQNIITDETNRENLLDIIASASDSKVMVEVVLKLFNSMLQDNMPEELKDIIDLSKLPTSSWRSEAEKLLDIFLDINDANLFGEGEMTITNDLAIKIMTNIFDLELIKGQEEKIFRELFKMIPVIDGFEPDYSNVDWSAEPDRILDILKAVAEIGDISDFDFGTVNTLTVEQISKLIKAVNNSTLFRPMLLTIIDGEVTDIGDWTTDWLDNQITTNVMAPISEWDNEIDILARLIVNITKFDLNSFDLETSSNADIDKLGEILIDMNKSRLFNMNNITSVLEVTDPNSILYGADFTNLPDSKEAWDDEIVTLVKALKELKLIKPLDIDKHEQIGNLLNTVQDSIILGPNLKLILENSLSEIDPKFDSYIDLSEIDDADWVVELDVLNKLYSDFGEFTGAGFNLTSLIGANIESIMKDASDGQLATQIFGKIINEQLELILKEHNPKDESDVLIYDYTDQTTLKNNAKDVGKLIDFGNETRALFLSPDDKEQGLVVGNYIKSYNAAPGDPNRDFADAYFPAILAYANDINEPSPLEGLDMTSVDYELEGQLFIDFYEAESAYDKALVWAEINDTSTLTKAIMASLGHTI